MVNREIIDERQKIAFIFAHRPTDIWSTPLSIVNEFKRRGWETKIVSLFDENDQYTERNITKFLCNTIDFNKEYDIIMHMDWTGFNTPLFNKFHKLINRPYLVFEAADEPQNYYRNRNKAGYFDLILTPDYKSCKEYKENGHNAVWWTHFADTEIHYDRLSEPVLPVVSTRGPGGSHLLDALSQIMSNKFYNRNGLIGKEYGDFLSSGAIVLQNSRWKEITRRIFEGMACRRMIITDRLPIETHINDLFVENRDIVYYDTPEECISKINYYLHNTEERKRIAKNGYEKVFASHTQINRVDTILDQYENWIRNGRN